MSNDSENFKKLAEGVPEKNEENHIDSFHSPQCLSSYNSGDQDSGISGTHHRVNGASEASSQSQIVEVFGSDN